MEDAGRQTEREASMNYWPGTKIPKSNGNAFTSWKNGEPSILTKKGSVAQQIHLGGYVLVQNDLKNKRAFTIYSRVQAK